MRSDEKRGVGFSGYGRIEGNRVYGGQLGALRRIIEFSSFSADTWRLALPLTSSFVAASGASAAVAPVLVAVTVGLVLRPASRVLRPALPLDRRLLFTNSLALTKIPIEFGIIYISPNCLGQTGQMH